MYKHNTHCTHNTVGQHNRVRRTTNNLASYVLLLPRFYTRHAGLYTFSKWVSTIQAVNSNTLTAQLFDKYTMTVSAGIDGKCTDEIYDTFFAILH